MRAVVDNSGACRGNKIRSAHPPGLYEHGLVTVGKLDIDRRCLHGRDHLDLFGLAYTVATTDARVVEPLSIHARERGGAQLVAGTAPALAEGTAGIELVGGAERAITVKPEALEPGAYGKTGRGHETPPQGEARREVEMPLRHNRGTCMTHIEGRRETTVPDTFGEDVVLEPPLDCFKIPARSVRSKVFLGSHESRRTKGRPDM